MRRSRRMKLNQTDFRLYILSSKNKGNWKKSGFADLNLNGPQKSLSLITSFKFSRMKSQIKVISKITC